MENKKDLYGLIGYPLGHSFSKKFFTEKFDRENINAQYDLYPIEKADSVMNIIQQTPDLKGLNVTIPHKQAVIPFLNELEESAAAMGAVNVIKINRTSKGLYLKGYNSDAIGFENSLKPLLKPSHRKALVLGTGGASKAVHYVLNKLGIETLSVSRTSGPRMITYAEVTPQIMKEYLLVVNTTPLGMAPRTDTCPDLPYNCFTTEHLAYDVVYNPEETLFLSKAKQQGAAICNGMEMLYGQAIAAWQIWNE